MEKMVHDTEKYILNYKIYVERMNNKGLPKKPTTINFKEEEKWVDLGKV
jgi:hypothetical protein